MKVLPLFPESRPDPGDVIPLSRFIEAMRIALTDFPPPAERTLAAVSAIDACLRLAVSALEGVLARDGERSLRVWPEPENRVEFMRFRRVPQ